MKSRAICKHWKKGRCTKGDFCGFSHTGHQSKNQSPTTERNSTKLAACRNGSACDCDCDWLKKGKCNFFHVQVKGQGGHKESQALGGRQASRAQGGGQEGQAQGAHKKISQPDRAQCQFDGRCERIPNCPYIHSLEDFPLLQGRKQLPRRIPNNQGRK